MNINAPSFLGILLAILVILGIIWLFVQLFEPKF